MSEKIQERQRFIRYYKEQTGETEIDMHKVALFAAANGWALPKPTDPIDRLAAQFTDAARVEYRTDPVTKQPYRANHAFPNPRSQPGQQKHLWIDIDAATTSRPKITKSFTGRRENVVGDVVQLTLDAMHWNRIHPKEEPIEIALDLTDDVAWRLNVEERKAG